MVSQKLYTFKKKEEEKLSTSPFDGETNTNCKLTCTLYVLKIFADNQLARLYLVLQHLIREQQEMIRLSWLFLIDTHILHVLFRLFLSPEL